MESPPAGTACPLHFRHACCCSTCLVPLTKGLLLTLTLTQRFAQSHAASPQGTRLRCGIFVHFHYRQRQRQRKASGGSVAHLQICSCDPTESLEAGRHWRDGRDHAANEAHYVEIEYDDSE